MPESLNPLTIVGALEGRLLRLEYLLSDGERSKIPDSNPQASHTSSKDQTAIARLTHLEQRFSKLISQSTNYADILRLHQSYPECFDAHEDSKLTIAEQLAVIKASESTIQRTSSGLRSLQDLPVPTAESSVLLATLVPRIERAQERQQVQTAEMQSLRMRTAAVLQRWYEVNVLGGSECWSEWEGRLMEVEKTVRRREGQTRREEKTTEAYTTAA